ncbi:enoyl-CoA hydratase [Burkholderia sp. A9]|uniref:enoyl-CoA hydratase/isomerase family protein n=1 Tax=Burkholderia sp. A9 TaxID=1365108 RepID=UPI000575BC16|nr:enoyl-CoA hydratase-related protein [Burkholderia sp. A9]KHK59545.1 enoyl-CoA hydratase [Burkholderia sp. A9]
MTAETERENGRPVCLDIQDAIAEIQFNRPDTLNAIDVATARALLAAVGEIQGARNIRAVVLRGRGRGFMAGGDLAYFRRAPDPACAARRLLEPMHEAVRLLAALPCPVIASVHGPVAGGGMSLAMAADLCIAATSTTFNLAYARIGNSLDCSASWTLPRLVGLRKAMEIALLCDSIGANEAHRLGLVNFVAPDETLDEQTHALAVRVAHLPPLAAAAIKRQLNASFHRSLHAQLDGELDDFVRNAGTADFTEGVAAFLLKRAPRFEGR